MPKTWLVVRCPTCGWLHNLEKWQRAEPTAPLRNFGLKKWSLGWKGFDNEPLQLEDDPQLKSIYSLRIAPRTLYLTSLFLEKKLLLLEQVKEVFSRLFEEVKALGSVAFHNVGKPFMIVNLGKRLMVDYKKGVDLT